MIRKSNLIALLAVGALLVGAGTAFAASQAGPRGGGGGQGGMGYGVTAGSVVMDAAAEYIGISETALMTERHDGKSLAQIAVAHGKTASGLKQALTTAFKANLDSAVAAGSISAAQAAQALATFQSRVQTVIDRTDIGPMNGSGAGAGMGAGMGSGPCGGRP